MSDTSQTPTSNGVVTSTATSSSASTTVTNSSSTPPISQTQQQQQQQHRYYFNNVGTVKEVIYPNKAIIHFKLNGKDERAILLSKCLTIDGKALEDMMTSKQTIADHVKINDTIHFDCHIYDKLGPVGFGKDRCNYYAMKATKATETGDGYRFNNGPVVLPANGHYALGWLSEVWPRKGVITFDGSNGQDERAVFSAQKVYLYEKRLGVRQPLNNLLSIGDQLYFEAVPTYDSSSKENCHCPWQAQLVWKGKRPQIDPSTYEHAPTLASTRKDSLDSSSSSDLNGDESCSNSGSFLILPTSGRANEFIKGYGVIAKIISETTGLLFWYRRQNILESVFFTGNKTFKFGTNLGKKSLLTSLNEGDRVTFVADRAPTDTPTKWIAKQVVVNEDTTNSDNGEKIL